MAPTPTPMPRNAILAAAPTLLAVLPNISASAEALRNDRDRFAVSPMMVTRRVLPMAISGSSPRPPLVAAASVWLSLRGHPGRGSSGLGLRSSSGQVVLQQGQRYFRIVASRLLALVVRGRRFCCPRLRRRPLRVLLGSLCVAKVEDQVSVRVKRGYGRPRLSVLEACTYERDPRQCSEHVCVACRNGVFEVCWA